MQVLIPNPIVIKAQGSILRSADDEWETAGDGFQSRLPAGDNL